MGESNDFQHRWDTGISGPTKHDLSHWKSSTVYVVLLSYPTSSVVIQLHPSTSRQAEPPALPRHMVPVCSLILGGTITPWPASPPPSVPPGPPPSFPASCKSSVGQWGS